MGVTSYSNELSPQTPARAEIPKLSPHNNGWDWLDPNQENDLNNKNFSITNPKLQQVETKLNVKSRG